MTKKVPACTVLLSTEHYEEDNKLVEDKAVSTTQVDESVASLLLHPEKKKNYGAIIFSFIFRIQALTPDTPESPS